MKRNKRTKYVIPGLIVLCCMGFFAVYGSSRSQTSAGLQLQVIRASQLAVAHYPDFTRTITDPDQVNQLFKSIQALPISKPLSKDHITFCSNIATPLEYQLTFQFPNASEQHATLFPTPADCRTVNLNGVLHDAPDNAFWLEVAHILNTSEDELVSPHQVS